MSNILRYLVKIKCRLKDGSEKTFHVLRSSSTPTYGDPVFPYLSRILSDPLKFLCTLQIPFVKGLEIERTIRKDFYLDGSLTRTANGKREEGSVSGDKVFWSFGSTITTRQTYTIVTVVSLLGFGFSWTLTVCTPTDLSCIGNSSSRDSRFVSVETLLYRFSRPVIK